MLSGKTGQARKEAAEVLTIDSRVLRRLFVQNHPSKDTAEINRRKEALRKARAEVRQRNLVHALQRKQSSAIFPVRG